MLTTEFQIGDRVSQNDNGFGIPFESGTVTGVNVSAEGYVSYDVLWDGFDWQTVNWIAEDLTLIKKAA